MMSMCASHNVIEAQLNSSRVMPLFSFFYISIFSMTKPGKGGILLTIWDSSCLNRCVSVVYLCLQDKGWEDEEEDAGEVQLSSQTLSSLLEEFYNEFTTLYDDIEDEEDDTDALADPLNQINLQVNYQTFMLMIKFFFILSRYLMLKKRGLIV